MGQARSTTDQIQIYGLVAYVRLVLIRLRLPRHIRMQKGASLQAVTACGNAPFDC
jgi:hypothetical protein